MSGAWIMAGVTFREAARRKILWTAMIAGAAFLALFSTGLHFQVKDATSHNVPPLIVHQVQAALLQIGFYAVNMLAVVMTILTSVDTLSGEISSGTIQAIATKPLPRWEILMGKWLGFAGMIAIYIGGMFGGVAAVGYVIGGVRPHGTVSG
ncbi:MAG: ABC transporter permease, partial [Candidatus Acidiferrum sp.]